MYCSKFGQSQTFEVSKSMSDDIYFIWDDPQIWVYYELCIIICYALYTSLLLKALWSILFLLENIYKYRYNYTKWNILSLLSARISMLSVIATLYVDKKYGLTIPHRWISGPDTLLAVTTAICLFMFFKDIKQKCHQLINVVDSDTFGVRIIHTNRDTLRQWFKKDILDNGGHYSSEYFALHTAFKRYTHFHNLYHHRLFC